MNRSSSVKMVQMSRTNYFWPSGILIIHMLAETGI